MRRCPMPHNNLFRAIAENGYDCEEAEKVRDQLDITWHEMTDEVFNELFKRSPIKRTKLEGMKRNVRFLREGSAE